MNRTARAAHWPLEISLVLLLSAPLAARADVPDSIASAATPEAKGRAIAEEVDRRDVGFGDSKATLDMVLRNAHGQTSTRKLGIRTLEVTEAGEGDKTLIVFDEPRDVEGTALLSHTHVTEPDDQWLYLPALKRVKRISSVNKSGPFMGSEFAYEDFASQEVEKYDYRHLRDEPCGDLQCFMIERTPRYEHSGYTRQVAWVDQPELRFQKVEFYDRKGDLLKTLVFDDYRQYLDKHWRAHRMSMTNHQTKKSTDLVYSDYDFQTGLDGKDFEKNVLKRVR